MSGERRGQRSDPHGTFEHHQTYAIARGAVDPRDRGGLALSRNTVTKYLAAETIEVKFSTPLRPSKLDSFAEKLAGWLKTEAGKSRKQRRPLKRLRADLVALGLTGSYGQVAAFARDWRAATRLPLPPRGRSRGVSRVTWQTVCVWTKAFSIQTFKQTRDHARFGKQQELTPKGCMRPLRRATAWLLPKGHKIANETIRAALAETREIRKAQGDVGWLFTGPDGRT